MALTPSEQQIKIQLDDTIATAFFKHFSRLQIEVPKAAELPSLAKTLSPIQRLEVLRKEADLFPYSRFFPTDDSFQQAITDFINGKYE